MSDTRYPRPAVRTEDYAEIPEGSSVNFNPKTGTFQVYRYGRNDKGEKTKISIGTINRDLTFSFSDVYALKQENKRLLQAIAHLIEVLKASGVDVEKLGSDLDEIVKNLTANFALDNAPAEALKQNPDSAAQLKEIKQEVDSGAEISPKQNQNPETTQAIEVRKTIEEACDKTAIDTRKESRVVFPFDELACVAMMSSLSGRSDAYSMSQYYTTNKQWLDTNLLSPGLPDTISHDTFRAHLLMLDPKRFDEFYSELLGKFVVDNDEKIRVIACDGQAVRATGRIGRDGQKHGVKYFMNVFDTGALLCLCHKLIPKKKNEISVGFQMLDGIDVRGAAITADALNTQTCFVNSILNAGADYCLAVKDNQEFMAGELMALFNTTNPDHIKTHIFECECAHGRVEQRTVKVIPGRFLSRQLKDKWRGLAEGSVVMVTCERTNKRSRKTSLESRYYISSLSNRQPSLFGEIIRRHWFIENKMHWMLDCNYLQDRISGSSENYLCNRSALNNLSLGILYRYQSWLAAKGEEISLNQLRGRMANPQYCIEAMAVAFGLTP